MEGFLFLLLILLDLAVILLGHDTDDAFQGGDHLFAVDLAIGDGYHAAFQTTSCFHNDLVTHLEGQTVRGEIVYFSGVLKTNPHNFSHEESFLPVPGTPLTSGRKSSLYA